MNESVEDDTMLKYGLLFEFIFSNMNYVSKIIIYLQSAATARGLDVSTMIEDEF